jgi:hypothetical protein
MWIEKEADGTVILWLITGRLQAGAFCREGKDG